MASVSDAHVEAFDRDGAVLLPGLLASSVTDLAGAVAENMAAPSRFERTYRPADGTAGTRLMGRKSSTCRTAGCSFVRLRVDQRAVSGSLPERFIRRGGRLMES